MSRRTKLNGIEPFHARPATFYSYNRGRGHSKNRRFPKSGHSSFKTLYDGLRTKSDRKSAFRRDSGPSSEEDEWPRRDRSAVVGRRPGWEVDQLVSDSDEEDNQGGRSRNRTKNTALIDRFLGKKSARTHSHDDEELYERLRHHKNRLNAIERSIREATELRERGWQDTVRELRAVQAETEQKVFDLEEHVQSSEGRGASRSGTRSQQWRERVPASSQQRDDMSESGRANNHRLRHGPGSGNFASEDVGVLPQRGHDIGPHDMEARIRLASQRARELEENLLIDEPSASLPRERHVSFEEQLCVDEFASESNNPRELRPDTNQFPSDLFHTPSRPCAPAASFQLSPSANPIAPAAPVADHYCGSPSFPYDEEVCAKRVVSHFPTLPLNEEGRDSSYTFACLSLLNRSIQRSKNLIQSEEGSSGEKPSSLLQSIANMTSVFDFDQDVPPREGEKGNGQVNGTENVFAGECPWEDNDGASQQGRVNGSILLDSSARTPPLERAFNKTITLMKAHHTAFADPNVPTVWRAALEQSTRQLIDVDQDYREDQPPQQSFYNGSVCGEVGYGTNNPHPIGAMGGCNEVQRDRRFDELLDSLEHGDREAVINDDHLSERNQNSEFYAGQGDVEGQYRQDNRHPNWEGSVRGGDVNSSRRSRHYGERAFFDQRHFNPDNNPWGMNTPQMSEI